MTVNLKSFYENVKTNGYLRTEDHAKRWTDAVLKITGHHLKRGTRKKLADALPNDLRHSVTRIFWLVKLHEPSLPADEFQHQIAKRAGATDSQFAYNPMMAVFSEVKKLINQDLSNEVKGALPTAIGELWAKA